MPTSHRGLPPPAAMALPPQQSTSSSLPHPTQLSVNPPQQTGTPHLSGQSWTTLPTPTSTWQEESLRNWLQARSEEEKTRQEEEKTRQETLRLEQRKIEAEMLRQSIGGGIPPAMIPIVFAGMGGGGTLPQTALEWAQQFMSSAQGGHHPQLLPAQVPVSPRHQRDQQPPPPGQYASGTPTAASYGPYPASPSRARAQGTGPPVGHPMATTSSLPASGGVATPSAQLQPQPGQEASPGISFHHWQPPQSYGGGGTTRPGSPSGDPPRKRKATGPQPVGSSFSNEQRLRSLPLRFPKRPLQILRLAGNITNVRKATCLGTVLHCLCKSEPRKQIVLGGFTRTCIWTCLEANQFKGKISKRSWKTLSIVSFIDRAR
ncbi:hypothetical protein V2G26_016062 [Clonostachys chloroleuca]